MYNYVIFTKKLNIGVCMFSFESNAKYINWLDLKHIILLFSIVIFVCITLYFLLFAKSKKGIMITKIILASILFILEIGRIIWTVVSNNYFHKTTNWLITLNFESCTMMVWLNIALVILSLFLNKDNKFLIYLYNISFGIGLVGGVITFIYPAFINSYYSIFHFENLQSIISHIILIVLPLYYLKTKQFSPRLKDFWIIPFTYICVGNLSAMASIIANWNFAFTFYCMPFLVMGVKIPFPFHILTIFLLLSSIMFLVYTIFEIKNKSHFQHYSKLTKFEYISIMISCIYLVIYLILLSNLKDFSPSLIGLVYLIPLFVFISLEFIFYKIIK